MSLSSTIRRILMLAAAVVLATGSAGSVLAAPAQSKVNADQTELDEALARFDEAKNQAAGIDAEVAATFAELDDVSAKAEDAQSRLRSRVVAAYRSPDADLVFVLLGASNLQDLVTRWDLLTRIVRQDAETLRALTEARAQAEQAAQELMSLQSQQAQALDTLAEEVARAERELAQSEAALREYQAETAAKAAEQPVSTPAPVEDRRQQLSGSGDWETAVASHYGRNFSGRGASGASIGPYTMMVAHKTLPFGTLVEFEYEGKRAVASVEDRGPHVAGRTWDLGPGVVRALGFNGVHEVRYRVID